MLRVSTSNDYTLLPQMDGSIAANGGPAGFRLGTFNGVFMPVFLSIWSLLFYLRFGFLLGHGGILGVLLALLLGYFITTMTALSVSAICTNGRVKGGGPYYIISRCLGAEFGGSIGLVFYIGAILGTASFVQYALLTIGCAMSCVGFVEPLMNNFGKIRGAVSFLPPGMWFETGYATLLLLLCTVLCVVGPNTATAVLNLATLTSIGSLLLSSKCSPSVATFTENLLPHYSPTFAAKDLFAILFPSCCGILAGASMSGELKHPSRSIPAGTLYGMALTLAIYILSIFIIGATVPRQVLLEDYSFMQTFNLLPITYVLGAFASCIFGVFGGLVGTAKLLEAVAKDRILPFSHRKNGYGHTLDVIFASEKGCLFITYALTQGVVILVSDLNAIAPFFTQTNLLCYAILNLACLLLRVSGAPNFRPSFRYFKSWTAASGLMCCFLGMFMVDAAYASISLLVEILLFCAIYFYGEPKKWGDVSQVLIYHQVRKYLLKMDRRNDNVKSWRPQVILLVNSPNEHQNLIQFCNHLKKGSLYVLAHVIEAPLETNARLYKLALNAWLETVENLSIKAFVHVAMAPSFREGAQGVMMGAGLGSMRPNIVITAFPENHTRMLNGTHGNSAETSRHMPPLPPVIDIPFAFMQLKSPTLSSFNFIHLLQDALLLDHAVAVGRHFDGPLIEPKAGTDRPPIYIDLWPACFDLEQAQHVFEDLSRLIQRSPTAFDDAHKSSSPTLEFIPMCVGADSHFNSAPTVPSAPPTPSPSTMRQQQRRKSTLTMAGENDVASFTLVLQLGSILRSVSEWKENYKVRLWILVEHRCDISVERAKVSRLLQDLRMQEEVRVVCLEDEDEILRQVTVDIAKDDCNSSLDGKATTINDHIVATNKLQNPTTTPVSNTRDIGLGIQNSQSIAGIVSDPLFTSSSHFASGLRMLKAATAYQRTATAETFVTDDVNGRSHPIPNLSRSSSIANIRDLPLPVRVRMLNALFKKYSPPSVTAILFTLLPALPHVKYSARDFLTKHHKSSRLSTKLKGKKKTNEHNITHKDHEVKVESAMQQYIANLETLTNQLGPTFMVQAQKITVTTNL